MNKKVVIAALAIAIAIIATSIYAQYRHDDTPTKTKPLPVNQPQQSASKNTMPEAMAVVSPEDDAIVVADVPTNEADETTPGAPTVPCIPLGDDAISHPWVAAELKRVESILPMGDAFEVFRGANRASVESMAVQGNSAAMYILARMHLLASRGLPDERAYTDLLDFQQTVMRRPTSKPREVSNEERESAQAQAHHWLYQAALHGRTMALLELGFMEDQKGETVITKGWISETDFNELDDKTQRSMKIPAVYIAMVDMLIPELATGVGGALREEDMNIEALEPVAIVAADAFINDMTQAGQNLPQIAASDGPDWEAFQEQMCKPDLSQFGQ